MYSTWPNLAYLYGISTDWMLFCFYCWLLWAARQRQRLAVPPWLCSSTPQQNERWWLVAVTSQHAKRA